MTVADVAATLKLNQQTVRNWIDQGRLPALRVGRRVRIKRSDFERILDESYTGRSAPPPRREPSADDFWGGELVGLAELGDDLEGEGPDGEAADREPVNGEPVDREAATGQALPGDGHQRGDAEGDAL
jgi:excisionase family DNA binding protein